MSAVADITPSQLTFQCKLKDCNATLELTTHGSRNVDGAYQCTQLSGDARISVKKRGLLPKSVRVAWALAELPHCFLDLWDSTSTLWLHSASFDLDPQEIPRLSQFLASLGINIKDNRKDVQS